MSGRVRSTACPLCEATGNTPVLTGYDRVFARAETYEYVRCAGCGLLFQDPLPDPGDLPGFYPEDYAPHRDGRAAVERKLEKPLNRLAIRYYYGTDSGSRSRLLRSVFRALSGRMLAETYPPHGGNRFLDVGCGSGARLAQYAALGWEVRGIEVSPRAVRTARTGGLEVHCGTVFDAPFEPWSFDHVQLNHVIEHVLDPVAVLRSAARFLAPGGRLVVVTPNAAGHGLARFGSCWASLDAPRHIMLFDLATARLLGERAGLAIRSLTTRAVPRILSESRDYLRRQGRELPDGIRERRDLIDAAARAGRPSRAYRRWIAPLAAVNARRGRGEVMDVEYARREPR